MMTQRQLEDVEHILNDFVLVQGFSESDWNSMLKTISESNGTGMTKIGWYMRRVERLTELAMKPTVSAILNKEAMKSLNKGEFIALDRDHETLILVNEAETPPEEIEQLLKENK
jgi:hypothetical protein